MSRMFHCVPRCLFRTLAVGVGLFAMLTALPGCGSGDDGQALGQLTQEIQTLQSSIAHLEQMVDEQRQAAVAAAKGDDDPSVTPTNGWTEPLATLDETFTLAAKAREDGDAGLSRTLLLNAANRRLGDAIALEQIVDVAVEHHPETREAMLVALDMAQFQVPPDQVIRVVGLTDRIGEELDAEREAELAAGESAGGAIGGATEADAALNGPPRPQVTAADLESAVSMREATERLSNWLGEASQELDRTDAKAAATIEGATADLSTLAVLVFARNGLDRLKRSDLPAETAASILQSVESQSSRLWGLPRKGMSPELATQLDTLPVQLATAAEMVQQRQSRPALKTLRELVQQSEQAAKAGQSSHQDRIDALSDLLAKSQKELEGISGSEPADEAKRAIQTIADRLATARTDQVRAYQAWVVKQCRMVFDHYDSEKQVTESDALHLFVGRAPFNQDGRRSLATVDQTLLNTEVGRLFNDVLGKLIVEMSPQQIVAVETEMADPANKVKLSEF